MFKKLLILFVLVGVLQATPQWKSIRPIVPKNNIERTKVEGLNGRVTGGSEAAPGQFPYMVALILDGVGLCGASLISETIVLTAGHCLDGFITIEAHFGAHNLYDYDEAGRVIVVSRDANVHEGYDLLTIANDIAFLRLAEPVTLSPNIELLRLPSRSQSGELFIDLSSTVSGWGIYNSTIGELSPVLKYAELLTMSNSDCESFYPGFLLESMICAVEVTGNSCNSDSGGPLVITESDGIPTEIGIVSFGTSRICENLEPGGYTRLTSYLDWIEENAGVVIRP